MAKNSNRRVSNNMWACSGGGGNCVASPAAVVANNSCGNLVNGCVCQQQHGAALVASSDHQVGAAASYEQSDYAGGGAGMWSYRGAYVAFLCVVTGTFVLFAFVVPVARHGNPNARAPPSSHHHESPPPDNGTDGDASARQRPIVNKAATPRSYLASHPDLDHQNVVLEDPKGYLYSYIDRNWNIIGRRTKHVDGSMTIEINGKYGHNFDGNMDKVVPISDASEVINYSSKSIDMQKFLELCDAKIPQRRAAGGICGYQTNGHPLLLLQPVAYEEVLMEPPMVIYYGLLTLSQMRRLVELSRARLLPGGTYGNRSFRVSRVAFLPDDADPALMRWVSTLAGAITGLDMRTAEPIQVVHYEAGGYYMPHVDFIMDHVTGVDRSQGNRIATLLWYLNDVGEGGATAFPNLDVRVAPTPGSAVFWYNLRRSGIMDERSVHGACTVTRGVKWAANFWFREQGQELRRLCGLNWNV